MFEIDSTNWELRITVIGLIKPRLSMDASNLYFHKTGKFIKNFQFTIFRQLGCKVKRKVSDTNYINLRCI